METPSLTAAALITCLLLTTCRACPVGCDCNVTSDGLIVYCRQLTGSHMPDDFPADSAHIMLCVRDMTSLRDGFPALPQLHTLEMDDCGLTDITADVFSNLTALRTLKLNKNKIRALDGNAFRGLKELREIRLDENQLTSLPTGLFTGLNLEEAWIGHNDIGTISSETFTDASIVHLNLDGNALSKIDSVTVFPMKTSLKRLSIAGNRKPLYLEAGLLSDIILDELLLSDSHISDMDFLQTVTARTLDLSGNVPSSFSLQYENLRLTEDIRLQMIRLSSLPQGLFEHLTNLQRLDLSDNTLQGVTGAEFRGMRNLTVLQLNNNTLNSLPSGLGKYLPHLKELHIRLNHITRLQPGDLDGLSNLEMLDLAHNRLQVLPQSLRPLFDAIPKLDLHLNPLHCNCEMSWFAEWLKVYRLWQSGPENCISPRFVYIYALRLTDFICTPPTITLVTDNVTVLEGTELLLQCSAEADPAPRLIWTADDNYGSISVSPPQDRTITTTHLVWHISNVHLHHSGLFTCMAANLKGSVKRQICVNVKSNTTGSVRACDAPDVIETTAGTTPITITTTSTTEPTTIATTPSIARTTQTTSSTMSSTITTKETTTITAAITTTRTITTPTTTPMTPSTTTPTSSTTTTPTSPATTTPTSPTTTTPTSPTTTTPTPPTITTQPSTNTTPLPVQTTTSPAVLPTGQPVNGRQLPTMSNAMVAIVVCLCGLVLIAVVLLIFALTKRRSQGKMAYAFTSTEALGEPTGESHM